MSNADPAIGDYVGVDIETGLDVYVCAVDRDARTVKIGPLNVGGASDWLNETEARAQYNYEWGAHLPIPWLMARLAAMKDE